MLCKVVLAVHSKASWAVQKENNKLLTQTDKNCIYQFAIATKALHQMTNIAERKLAAVESSILAVSTTALSQPILPAHEG